MHNTYRSEISGKSVELLKEWKNNLFYVKMKLCFKILIKHKLKNYTLIFKFKFLWPTHAYWIIYRITGQYFIVMKKTEHKFENINGNSFLNTDSEYDVQESYYRQKFQPLTISSKKKHLLFPFRATLQMI